jgi:MoaA/NifB/PqqE/SkfB family radical SAM enzyme
MRRRGAAVGQKKTSSTVRPTTTEPIACSHCPGQAYLMRRTLHPKIKGEIWTFECKDCGKQTEKSVLH